MIRTKINEGDFLRSILCVKILQDNLNKANVYHKRRRLTTNTAELGCLAWDVMRNFFYSDLTVK